jgi:acyl-CoA thioester hydrolase
MERARTEWLRAAGVNQAEMLNEQRRMFVVTATNAEFLAPARFNDEVMVTARLAGLTRATFDIEQNIFLQGPKGRLLVRGNITAAFLNADNMRPMRVPADIFEDKN